MLLIISLKCPWRRRSYTNKKINIFGEKVNWNHPDNKTADLRRLKMKDGRFKMEGDERRQGIVKRRGSELTEVTTGALDMLERIKG